MLLYQIPRQHVANRILLALRKNNHTDDDTGVGGNDNKIGSSNNNRIVGKCEDNNDKVSPFHSNIISEISCIQLSGSDEFSKEIVAIWACNKLGLDHGRFTGNLFH